MLIFNALLGGLWRHALGGWDGPFMWAIGTRFEPLLWGPDDHGIISPRRGRVLLLGALLSWPLWIALPWWQAAIGTVLCDLFWRFGHRLDSWTIWLRYGPFAVSWVVARWIWGSRPERPGDFLNNWMAVGETGAGVHFWGTVAGVLLFA